MYRFILFSLFSTLVLQPQSTSALSCIQESFEDQINRAAVITTITAKNLLSVDRSSSISSNFKWNVSADEIFKGNVTSTFTLTDSVWPGMPDTQSRIQKGESYIVFINSAYELGLCDYPRNIDTNPLTTEEEKILGIALSSSSSSSSSSINSSNSSSVNYQCNPYQCKDGTTFQSCTANGDLINYFAAPCHANGGEVGTNTQVKTYSDVNSQTLYVEGVTWGTNEGIVQGNDDGTFRPTSNLNRAEFVTIMTRAHDKWLQANQINDWEDSMCIAAYENPSYLNYSDVSSTNLWYFGSVCRATSQNWVQGYEDGTFKPNATINIAEAAKIIVKQHSNNVVQQSQTTDWYTPFISYLQVRNALPFSIKFADQYITRAEMIEILFRLETNNPTPYIATYPELTSSSSSNANERTATITELNMSIVHPAAWGIIKKNTSANSHVDYNFPQNTFNPVLALTYVPNGTKEECFFTEGNCETVDTNAIKAEIRANPDTSIAGLPMQVRNYYDVPSGLFIQTYLFYHNDYEVLVKHYFDFPKSLEDEYYDANESLLEVYEQVMGNDDTTDAIERIIALYPEETEDMQQELNSFNAFMRTIVLR